jgi:hypothetical protein
VLGLVALAAIALAIWLIARRSGERKRTTGAWRQRAADETAETGATARLVAAGTPVSAAMSQQLLASSRALEDLTRSAPDEHASAAIHAALRAVQALTVAVEADAAAQRAQHPAATEQREAADAALRAAAADTDRIMRTSYRQFTQ